MIVDINDNVVMMLVGNKSDLEHLRQVTTSEAAELAETLGMSYCETSATQYDNVDAMFRYDVSKYFNIK